MIDFSLIRKWFGPALITILILIMYQLFVAPTINDMRDDWMFLHNARLQAIQQQIQASQKNKE